MAGDALGCVDGAAICARARTAASVNKGWWTWLIVAVLVIVLTATAIHLAVWLLS